VSEPSVPAQPVLRAPQNCSNISEHPFFIVIAAGDGGSFLYGFGIGKMEDHAMKFITPPFTRRLVIIVPYYLAVHISSWLPNLHRG